MRDCSPKKTDQQSISFASKATFFLYKYLLFVEEVVLLRQHCECTSEMIRIFLINHFHKLKAGGNVWFGSGGCYF